MATRGELIAHRLTVDEIAKQIGADSLAYLSVEGMLRAAHGVEGALVEDGDAHGHGQRGFCVACFSGNYPVHIPPWLFDEQRDKTLFEEKR